MDAKIKKVVTPKFRVSFPVVFQAQKNIFNGKEEYSIVMIISKTLTGRDLEAFNAMKQLAKDTAVEAFGGKIPKNFRNPIRDGDVDKSDRDEYKNTWFITARSKQRPGLVDDKLQPIIEQDQFYPGCYARATVTCYAYGQDPRKTAGNAGVSFGLQNIQKLDDGDPLVSRVSAENDFEPIGDTSSADPDGTANVDKLFG